MALQKMPKPVVECFAVDAVWSLPPAGGILHFHEMTGRRQALVALHKARCISGMLGSGDDATESENCNQSVSFRFVGF